MNRKILPLANLHNLNAHCKKKYETIIDFTVLKTCSKTNSFESSKMGHEYSK